MSGMTATATGTTAHTLRDQVEHALERLSHMVAGSISGGLLEQQHAAGQTDDIESVQQTIRFLGQVTAGFTQLPPDALPADGAGFGSDVVVDDVDTGSRSTWTLMSGPLLDIDAGQVSLASPVGQALLGCRPGDVVHVETPQRTRTFRVMRVTTLQQRLREEDWTRPAA